MFRYRLRLMLCSLLLSVNSWAVSFEPSLQDIAVLETLLAGSAQLSEQEVTRSADQLKSACSQIIVLLHRRSVS
jgi:hypothetical protein